MEKLIRDVIKLNMMYSEPLQEVLVYAVECLVRHTESQIGFFNRVDYENGDAILNKFTWSKSLKTVCSLKEPAVLYTSQGGLWAEAINSNLPIIINDYSQPHPAKHGLPVGHAPLHRLLLVPVVGIPLIGSHPGEARVVMLAGVANKPEPYTELDGEKLVLVMEATWRHILRHNLLAKHERDRKEMATVNEQLKTSNQDLAQFAYIASHDLKAPLRAVYNLATWIEEDHAAGKDISKHIAMLKPKVQRMDALINGLLDYSRIDHGVSETTLVHTNSLVRDVIEDVDNGFGHVAIVGSLPDVRYNALHLGQVFSNLISNAIKHHPDPDRCRVEVSSTNSCRNPNCPCPKHHGSREHCHTFCISDNGVGIDPKYHKKIFDIFQTLKPKDETQGTGIGLSLVKKITEQHDGCVWLESEPGKGSKFFFSVPK